MTLEKRGEVGNAQSLDTSDAEWPWMSLSTQAAHRNQCLLIQQAGLLTPINARRRLTDAFPSLYILSGLFQLLLHDVHKGVEANDGYSCGGSVGLSPTSRFTQTIAR